MAELCALGGWSVFGAQGILLAQNTGLTTLNRCQFSVFFSCLESTLLITWREIRNGGLQLIVSLTFHNIHTQKKNTINMHLGSYK